MVTMVSGCSNDEYDPEVHFDQMDDWAMELEDLDPTTLNPVESALAATWGPAGLMDNSGPFEFARFGGEDEVRAVNAFDEIGLTEAAKSIRLAYKIYEKTGGPDSEPSGPEVKAVEDLWFTNSSPHYEQKMFRFIMKNGGFPD